MSELDEVENERKAKYNILVIDDDEGVCEVIQGYIESKFTVNFDYENDGVSALKTAKQKPFDVIVCDYQMPVLNGSEFIHALRSEDTINRSTPIIFLSGYRPNIKADKTIWENVFFVEKPFSEQKIQYYVQCSLNLKNSAN